MKNINDLVSRLELAQAQLCSHPLYKELGDVNSLKVFMSYHVFAVWDFMSLLKALQRELCCVDVPWRPSAYPKELTRFVNEIVLGEESDIGPDGKASDHFSLYLKAMEELKIDTLPIKTFLENFDEGHIPAGARSFVSMNLKLAQSHQPHKIAAAFFYGREKLIPEMFSKVLESLQEQKSACPTLVYYLERHIELDGQEHGQLAQECLRALCLGDEDKLKEAYSVGLESIAMRSKLWDEVLEVLKA